MVENETHTAQRELVFLLPAAAPTGAESDGCTTQTKGTQATGASSLRVLPVPDGLSYLSVDCNPPAGGNPPVGHKKRRREPRLTRRKPRSSAATIIFEPVRVHNQLQLLMLHDQGGFDTAGVRVRHNGQRALPVTLLSLRDELHIDGHDYFVSARRGDSIGRPEDRHVGTQCPFCRVVIQADTRVWSCSCGAALHHEDERWPQEQRLECATLASVCPNCQGDIEFGQGLEWEPEL